MLGLDVSSARAVKDDEGVLTMAEEMEGLHWHSFCNHYSGARLLHHWHRVAIPA